MEFFLKDRKPLTIRLFGCIARRPWQRGWEENMADEEGAYYLERILFAYFTLFLHLFSFLELKNALEDDF